MALLVALSVPLDTITEYVPASSAIVLGIENVALMAPTRLVPALSHWYVGSGTPVAVTLNAAG